MSSIDNLLNSSPPNSPHRSDATDSSFCRSVSSGQVSPSKDDEHVSLTPDSTPGKMRTRRVVATARPKRSSSDRVPRRSPFTLRRELEVDSSDEDGEPSLHKVARPNEGASSPLLGLRTRPGPSQSTPMPRGNREMAPRRSSPLSYASSLHEPRSRVATPPNLVPDFNTLHLSKSGSFGSPRVENNHGTLLGQLNNVLQDNQRLDEFNGTLLAKLNRANAHVRTGETNLKDLALAKSVLVNTIQTLKSRLQKLEEENERVFRTIPVERRRKLSVYGT